MTLARAQKMLKQYAISFGLYYDLSITDIEFNNTCDKDIIEVLFIRNGMKVANGFYQKNSLIKDASMLATIILK